MSERIFALLWPLCFAAGCLMAARTLFHWFQLESYQFHGYFRTLRRQGLRALLPGLLMFFGTFAFFLLTGTVLRSCPAWLTLPLCLAVPIALGAVIQSAEKKRKEKKKLVFTPRMKRLYFVSLLLWTIINMGIVAAVGYDPVSGAFSASSACLISVFPLLLPLWTALGGLLAWPVEKIISECYFRDAQRILKERDDLTCIGITGSWGKTSVKFILGSLLSERYPVLVTPASYNTPMGVTKVIRTQLEPGHRIFVAEMGARHVGDIREMCRLVHPDIGILTSVGPQHLDTFRTQERITKTKYELIEAIPEDGRCFFADDDGIVLDLWKKTDKEKYLAGLNSERDDVWAEDIRVSPSGSSFYLCTRSERVFCETGLLGELNIRNIVLCAGVCFQLGMNGKEIARGIRKLKPVEHRLELKPNPSGITVIDDAFNSNIRGAMQAFEVLSSFPGRRIVVTPGMVELGDMEEQLNREFGRAMADCCDEAVLVGRRRSEAIRAGLEDGRFDTNHVHVTQSLQEAADLLKTLAVPGDTILFENDLPDNYSEE